MNHINEMNILITESIRKIVLDEYPYLVIHDTSITYIEILLRPCMELLDNIKPPFNFTSIHNKLARIIRHELKRCLHTNNNLEEIINKAKWNVIRYLICEMIDPPYYTRIVTDNIVFPWDIRTAIVSDKHLLNMINASNGKLIEHKFPVTVIVGKNIYEHISSEEFICGLLLFFTVDRTIYDSSVTIKVRMFGDIISPTYMKESNRFNTLEHTSNISLFDVKRDKRTYSLEVSDVTYYFNSTDFMKGFVIGAYRVGVDSRDYWKNLRDYTDDINGKDISHSVTF